jgi:hypothetical protein
MMYLGTFGFDVKEEKDRDDFNQGRFEFFVN